jgi:SAM-dependent methyltransferase
VTRKDIAKKLAALFDTPGLRQFAYWKVRTDPAYAAALEQLRGRNTPLLDVGCGIGLLAFFLRESGFTAPITGIDFDRGKIDVARRISSHYRDVQFLTGDAAELFQAPPRDVVILDLLQYVNESARRAILENAARCGDVVVIRQGLRDGSWRHRFTQTIDVIGRAIRWNRGEPIRFPTREEVTAPFAKDFAIEVRPMWGRTPYNNYLFVMRRSSSGTTNA